MASFPFFSLQDKIEMVEDVEYENQIHCKVQMQKSCRFINSPAAASDDQELVL